MEMLVFTQIKPDTAGLTPDILDGLLVTYQIGQLLSLQSIKVWKEEVSPSEMTAQMELIIQTGADLLLSHNS